jgi:hypothetical protein
MTTHELSPNNYVFLVVQDLQKLTCDDSMFHFSMFRCLNNWQIIGLHQLYSKSLYMIDLSSKTGWSQTKDSVFLYCPSILQVRVSESGAGTLCNKPRMIVHGMLIIYKILENILYVYIFSNFADAKAT